MKKITLILFVICCSIVLSNSQRFGFRRPGIFRPFRPFFRPFRPFRRPFGKREIISNSTVDLLDIDDIKLLNESDKNVCFFSTNFNFMNCFGQNETIACEVEPRFDQVKNVTVKLTNLEMVEEENVLKLVEKGSNFTMVLPQNNTKISVTLKNVDDFSGPGIFINSDECMSSLLSFVHKFEQIDFILSIFL